MNTDRWQDVAALFDRAAELPPAERAAFLDAEAGDDPALREEVEALLAFDDGATGLLDRPAPEPAPPPEAGPWRLSERVGRGGMGEVWRADRPIGDDGLRQTAAVKLVRPGLSDEVAARFRAERRILAGLDHPAIARLLGGGTASDGRPFLATEFVNGEPITAYADRRRLGVNERLALFAEVCEAVAYAHARLVVHRDLKPSNVLVTDDGRVKLLDFGIAKLLGDDDGLRTRTGRPVLTPAYAAPEQATGGVLTTATDVYGLGVLLYELLVGSRPAPGGDATRPSDAVTTAGPTGGRVPPRPAPPAGEGRAVGRGGSEREADGCGAAPDTGALRSTTADRLRRRLRGDLDRICLKALRADPARRYHGAAELGADVQRHLDGLPVEARPESRAYRVGKFVRRNRATVAAAAVALLAVVGGAGAALWQAAEAEAERDESAAVVVFLESALSSADPDTDDVGGSVGFTVREFLDIASGRIEADLPGQPAVQAQLHAVVGRVYSNLSAFEEARHHLSQALDGLRRTGDGASAQAGVVLSGLAEATYLAGDVEGAADLFAEAIRVHRALGDPAQLDLAVTLSRYGSYLWFVVGDMEGAAGPLRESAEIVRHVGDQAPAARRPDVAVVLNGYATLLHRRGDYAEAEEAYTGTLDVWREWLAANPEAGPQSYAISLSNYADLNRFRGRLDRAEALEREALSLHRKGQSEGIDVALSHAKLGRTLLLQGRRVEADSLLGVALPMLARAVPADSPYLLLMRLNRATAAREVGRVGEARREVAALGPAFAAALPPDHPAHADLLLERSRLQVLDGDAAGAERSARDGLALLEASGNDRDIRTARLAVQLGASLAAQGRTVEARRAFARGARLFSALQVPGAPEAREARRLAVAVP